MIPVIYVVIIVLAVLAVTAYWAVRLENRIQRTEEAVSRLIVRVSTLERVCGVHRDDRRFDT